MITLYDATIPVFRHGLGTMQAWLRRAERHAEDSNFPMARLLEARLAPDMFNLIQQVGYAYFTSLEAAGNLSGRAPPEMGYDEKSAADLGASLSRVMRYLESIGPADVAAGTDEVETFLLPDRKIRLDRYVRFFALPNFYFHIATAYGILRHEGVPLGKADYIGTPPVDPGGA